MNMKKPLKVSYCRREEKPCIRWVEKYLKDCLCNFKDEISFALGISSLICWGIAEIPQIITNYRNKSANGVSLAFLSTWIIGDMFNVVGCILEPATLPTQFYTALLYTVTTILLALQCIYYDHFLTWWKCRHTEVLNLASSVTNESVEPNSKYKLITTSNVPVEVPRQGNFYYTSARSLARSTTPPIQCSYIKAMSGPCAFHLGNDSSSEDESVPEANNIHSMPASQPLPIPRPAGYGSAFLAAAVNLPARSKALMFLQEEEVEGNAYGQWLGWLMAAIYMGGRIPQIWLNIRRGSVEGLNPLMFIFALIANATYVGSILVRTTKWEKIKANMPWLLDAVVCVVLDVFIILQYFYYKYVRQKGNRLGGYHAGGYVEEANKPLVSS